MPFLVFVFGGEGKRRRETRRSWIRDFRRDLFSQGLSTFHADKRRDRQTNRSYSEEGLQFFCLWERKLPTAIHKLIRIHTYTQKNTGKWEVHTWSHRSTWQHCWSVARSWVPCSRALWQWVAFDLCDKTVRALLILWCPQATPCCAIPLHLNQEPHPPPRCLSSCLSTSVGLSRRPVCFFCVR